MASPAYTHDLTTFNLAENSGTWVELTGTAVPYNAGGAPDMTDTDDPIQGSYVVSATAAMKSGIGSIACNYGSGVTIPADGGFFIWHKFDAGGLLDLVANGGVRACVGSSLTAFKVWKMSGKDVAPFPYGGWANYVIDPTVSADYTEGSPAATLQFVGMAILLTAAGPSKGQPHKVDAIRFGRGEARFTGGESANYATIAGFAALNDATTARWGLIQAISGGYLWKGLISLGSSDVTTSSRARSSNVATIVTGSAHKLQAGDVVTVAGLGGTGYNGTFTVASVVSATSFTYANPGTNEGTQSDTGGTVGCIVDFRDSNKIVFIADTRKVGAAFNKIEVRHASSRVDLTGLSFICLSPSTTASKGRFEAVQDADINIDTCLFQDMDTIIFQAGSTILKTIFRRCGQVTQGGAVLTDCTFDRPSGAVGLVINDLPDVGNCSFISDGTGHAIEGFSAAGTYDISGLSFSGYAASDGSTGNEAIHVTATSGTVTLSYAGTAPSVKSDGATIVKETSQITLTISPIITGSDVVIYDSSTGAVLEESQEIGGTSYQYIYPGADIGDYVDIGLFKAGYTPLYIRGYQLGSSNATVPAAQQVDRFYID